MKNIWEVPVVYWLKHWTATLLVLTPVMKLHSLSDKYL